MDISIASVRWAAVQLASLTCVSICFAGPPALSLSALHTAAAAVAATATGTAAKSQVPFSMRHRGSAPSFAGRPLDLRPPAPPAADDAPGSAARHLDGSEDKHASGLAQLSLAKPMSPAEAFARRVHQEGLPVARLFESKSALVSVGLNQRGKPGLWLIQKTH
jgi:hypothetical protein